MNNIDSLKNDIKNKSFKNLYLFYGEEQYLIRYYEKEMRKIVQNEFEMMNFNLFHGRETSSRQIIDSAETLPFFCEYRLVTAKDTGFFMTGRKDESSAMANYVKEIPKSTILLFIEKEVDKRNSLYKAFSKVGMPIEFITPTEKELLKWVVQYCKKRHKTIDSSTAAILLRTVGSGMDMLSSELNKLIAYCGDESIVFPKDIELVCTKSVESKIFDLVGAIGNKNSNIALEVFEGLLQMKESPIMVLVMIARQFRIIMQCKHYAELIPYERLPEKLGLKSFIVRECLKQAQNFDMETLKGAYEKCLTADISIKTGRTPAKLAVETLILSII